MIVQALQQLRPTSEWLLDGEDYSGLVWLGDDKPTEEEVLAVIAQLLKAQNDLAR
jgi:hypothetical protein